MADVTVTTRPPRARPVFARHAASLLVVRNTEAGPEVLMGVRAGGHRFMPNVLVFPGGAVDPADASALSATEPGAATLAMLARKARPRLARAIALAAARELREETGLSLGQPPRLDAMAYLCRAITPPASPIRFNARFLMVPAEAVTGEPADSRELHSVRFRAVDAVLRGELMLVTREVLQRFQAWWTLAPDARDGRTSLDVFKGKRWAAE